MHTEEVLILAMTKMLSGICTAGLTRHRDADGRLQWLRPVREFDTLLPGDMTESNGRLIRCWDVVQFRVKAPRPDPPHVEDWTVDFVYQPPRVLRRLEGNRRAAFLSEHALSSLSRMLDQEACSLCLIKPDRVTARFSLDPYSGKYGARMWVSLPESRSYTECSRRGYPVTDLKWRALGRAWLGEAGGVLELPHDELMARMNAVDLYLTMGLSRSWHGQHWPLVHAVHLIPDYEIAIDLNHL